MDQKQLRKITEFIANNVVRNDDVVFLKFENETVSDLIDIIVSLHNLLCEAVTGNRYNYMFHWSNKEGYCVIDDLFDDILKEAKK